MAKEQMKRKKKIRGFRIYVWVLAALSVMLLAYVILMIYIIPTRGSGSPILGYRQEGIEDIESSWISDTEAFGGEQANVDEVTIFYAGLTVYFNVRVNEGTSLAEARTAAEAIGEFFIDLSDGVATDYDLQFVVSYGDKDLLRTQNQEALIGHVVEHRIKIIDEILTFAQQYNTQANISRVRDNLDIFGASFPEEILADFESRYENLPDPMTAEQEDAIRDHNNNLPTANVEQSIPQSELADFPNWGTWIRNRIVWN
ncbi:MAG: hypothetical protein FWE07_09415 [Turicibacter sp.]|nr:hypothetical protein [Turicibacter sp.]